MRSFWSQSVSRSLASALVWGLVFFAIFGLAFYAYAISFPDTQPNPASGNVGLFVGATPQTYNGAGAQEYEAAQGLCEAAFEYSHVCTSMEMINTYNHNPEALNGLTESFWLNNSSLSALDALSNDCQAWTSDLSVDFGSIWNTTERELFLSPCDQSFKYACCY